MAKLTKKQQEQLDKQNAHQAMLAETRQVIDSFRNLPDWSTSTPERKTEIVDYYIDTQWGPYAEQRWGNDLTTANLYKNHIVQTLRDEINKQAATYDTLGNTLSNAWASVERGGDNLYDSAVALGTLPDILQDQYYGKQVKELQDRLQDLPFKRQYFDSQEAYDAEVLKTQTALNDVLASYNANKTELQESMGNLAQALAKSEANEAARREAIPQRMYDYRRGQEIAEDLRHTNPDGWVFWRQVMDRPGYAGNLIVEQLANMLPQAGAALAGGAVGSLAGPAGTVAGGTLASSAMSALQGVGEVASGIAQEIFSADIQQLSKLPQYQELAGQGYSDREIRTQMVAKAVAEAAPQAAILTAATGILGPETMLARTSILQPLVKGGIVKRMGTAGVLSAPGEAVEEGGQQVIQNVGWNVATGDTRDITEGMGEAAALGAFTGGVLGSMGGIRRPKDATQQPPAGGTQQPPAPANMNLSGGSTAPQPTPAGGQPTPANTSSQAGIINIPGQTATQQVIGGTENAKYNPNTTEQNIQISDALQVASSWVDAISKAPQTTDTLPLMNALIDAENLGANPDYIDSILGAVQDIYNKDPNNTSDIRATYQSVKNSLQAGAQPNVGQQATAQQPTTGQPAAPQPVSQANQGGSNTGGTATGSQPAAPATGTNQPNIAAGTQAAGGVNATTQGTGSGGTAYTGTGTATGNVQANQPVGGSSGQGTNSGRNNSANGPGNAQSNTGNGGGTATPVQRTGNAGRAAQSGGTQATGLSPDADTAQTRVFVEQELVASGRTPEQAQRETEVLMRMLNTLGSVSGLTPAQQLQRLRFGAVVDKMQVVNSLYQFIGEKGAKSFNTYEPGMKILDNLELAEVMENSGRNSPSIIKMATGWERGADGLWRYELPDGKLKPDVTLERFDLGDATYYGTYLEDIYDMPDLYRAYPELRYTRVLFTELTEQLGFAVEDNWIVINDDSINKSQNQLKESAYAPDSQLISTLIHEIQHAIQHREGFALGGTPRDADKGASKPHYLKFYYQYLDSKYPPKSFDEFCLSEFGHIVEPHDTEFGIAQAKYENYEHTRFSAIPDAIKSEADVYARNAVYERLAGEVEARNSELRYLYGLQNNLASLAEQTERALDNTLLPRSEQIIITPADALISINTLYQTNERGRIDLLSNGTMNILFGENADASTAIHEFQHMFVTESLRILNDPTIPGSPQKAQLMADMIQLAKFAGIKADVATDFNAWTTNAHEKVARAFEQYFRNGVAPTPELDGLFAKMRELLIQIYQRAKMLLNRSISAEVQKVFDRQLTGYDTTTEQQIDSTSNTATVEPEVQVAASVETQLESADTASATNAANIAEEAYANPDNVMAQAKLEAAQDPADIASPLVTENSLTDADLIQLANGQLPAEVQAAVTELNSVMADRVSMTVRDAESVLETPVQPTPEEELAAHEQLVTTLNEGLAEGNVSLEGEELDSGDGTFVVMSLKQAAPATQPLAQSIQDIENQASLQRGAAFRAAQVAQVSQTTWAGMWKPGLWARAATWLRKNLVDGGAHFYLYCLQHFSNAVGDPMNNPLWRSFSTLSNNIFGAAKIFTETVLNPIHTWAEGIASRYSVDPDILAHNVGLYRTCLHTIEAAYKRQIELEQDLQAAYVMPAGQAKADAVIAAEEALQRFADRQTGARKDVDVYGGRSVAEAQAEIDRLITEMDALTGGQGQALLDEGNTYLHNGLRWITRWLMENGQLSEQDVTRFDEWNYYTPLTVETLANDKSNSDIFYFSPRQNFHRNGSTTPAQDGYQALVQYGCRASRTVGMSEFSYVMYEAYQTLKARGNLTGKLDGINFYDGMGLMPTDYINAVANDDIHASGETVAWAKSVQEHATTVIRVVEPDPNTGSSVTKAYYVMFAKQDETGKIVRDNDVADAVRNPFYSADPNSVINKMAKITSGYAWIYTRLRPYFPILTGVRDLTERASYLPTRTYTNDSGEQVSGLKIAAQMIGFSMNPVNFYRMARYWTTGSSGSSYFDQHLDDFFNSGTDMSGNYNKMLSNLRKKSIAEIEQNIPSEIERLGKKRVKQVVSVITKWGDFFYSIPAFAQFIKMRENQIDMRQTVYGVTTLMNMQQRGTTAGTAAALFPFVNSIGQTASNLLYSMGLHTMTFGGHPNAAHLRKSAIKGWAVMTCTYAAIRMLMPLIAGGLRTEDEDEEKGQQRLDMIPLGQVASFIPLGLWGDGSYIKWPTGFGPAMFGSLFAYGFDRIERGKLSYGDFMATALTTFAKSLVPNSMPAFEFSKDPMAFIMQTLSPMLLSPAMQVATNRTYSGQQLTYDSYNRVQRQSDRGNITTHMTWKEKAKWIYDVTSGTIDWSPEELRAVANGYMGGVLQGIVAWMEADPLYKHPMYQTTREELGPFWTTMGITSLYSAALNLERTAYYEAREHYENMIRTAGVGHLLKGDEEDKKRILAAAGFLPTEISDYIALAKTEKQLSDMNSDFRKELDKLYGPDMEESVIREKFANWGATQHQMFQELMPKLSFYTEGNRRRWGAPDKQASRELRGEVPMSAVEPRTTTLDDRVIPRNSDGSIAADAAIVIQDVDGLQVVIPTIGPNGGRWTREQAMANYFQNKQHLGKYRSIEAAQQALQNL
ncbi:MAG: hypothetical protein IJA20_02855 [Methanocorpusculum sp.]|nr:hypothetical protein [Methanocorpusculum sp.]